MPTQFQCRRIQPSAATRRLAVHRRKLSNLSRAAGGIRDGARDGARNGPLVGIAPALSKSFPKTQGFPAPGRALQVQPDLRTVYAIADTSWERRRATSASERSVRGRWKDLSLEEVPEHNPDDDPPCDI